jgi:hypothetical protein
LFEKAEQYFRRARTNSNVRVELEALGNVFMVKAVELDIKLRKLAKVKLRRHFLRTSVTKGDAIVSNRPSVLNSSSRYDHFLFAPICEDANGMQLSVLAALARMNVDPWEEAARLAAMPRGIVESTLVSTLDSVPGRGWNPSETEVIAARLVQLLPLRG